MIFVPLYGFEIAGILWLKYCNLLYFCFLGKRFLVLLVKETVSSLSLSSKNRYIVFNPFTSSICLTIVYLSYYQLFIIYIIIYINKT